MPIKFNFKNAHGIPYSQGLVAILPCLSVTAMQVAEVLNALRSWVNGCLCAAQSCKIVTKDPDIEISCNRCNRCNHFFY